MSKIRIIELESVSSTNDYAKDIAEDDVLVLTYDQRSGKGRLGRVWECKKGEAIAMSLKIKPRVATQDISMLTIIAAVALVRSFPVETMIKWPNDIVCAGKKVCGILTEGRIDGDSLTYAIIGIGVNVDMERFDGELEKKATSLYMESGIHYDKRSIVERFLEEFEKLSSQLEKTGNLKFIVSEYNSYLVHRDKEIVIAGKESIHAVACGIDERGELIAKTEEGIMHIRSGEVSVRGIYGYV
ncbi:MAG TPA: biotin--[acetyl-CoA-carboxylase] ligase [Eubacterium sp.]|nr:biotin--[acetyl-CoA-carboxylase] ligase [Eubacterium sp.]